MNYLNNEHIPNRFLEIDLAKGAAVMSMMMFHYFYLGNYMNVHHFNTNVGILKGLAKFAHTTFILASGANLAISIHNKLPKKYIPKKTKRGLFLLATGLIISFLTKQEFGEHYVKFGILHFLGSATILSTFIIKLPIVVACTSIAILVIHMLLSSEFAFKSQFNELCSKNPLFCFIGGIMNVKYEAMDHFSLIPNLGYFLMGASIAFVLYKINVVQKELEEIDNTPVTRNYKWLGYFDKYRENPIIRAIGWVGKRSLLFYVTHFVILYCVFKIIQIHSLPPVQSNVLPVIPQTYSFESLPSK